MNTYTKNYKKTMIGIACAVLVLILTSMYIYFLFLPGVWHNDTFLYRQSDGRFIGKDAYATYKMRITRTDDGADILFSVNDTKRQYEINSENTSSVKIYQDGEMLFEGSAVRAGSSYMLVDKDGEPVDIVDVTVDGTVPTDDELFPSINRLYNLALAYKYDIRGNAAMAVSVLIIFAVLAIDILFPNLFFILGHSLAVENAKPSSFYRFMQKIARVVLAIAIVVFVILTFTTR